MDPYAVLGIDRTATPQQIREAFRRQLRHRHPDTGGEAADAAEVRAVIDAYQLLMGQAADSRTDVARGGRPRAGTPPAPSPPCPTCGGVGRLRQMIACDKCAGTGEITYLGSGSARRLLCRACGGHGRRSTVIVCRQCGGSGRIGPPQA